MKRKWISRVSSLTARYPLSRHLVPCIHHLGYSANDSLCFYIQIILVKLSVSLRNFVGEKIQPALLRLGRRDPNVVKGIAAEADCTLATVASQASMGSMAEINPNCIHPWASLLTVQMVFYWVV